MIILEKYKAKQKFYKIQSLIQKYNNDLNNLLENEQLQEFEIEYLIINFELNQGNWIYICYHQALSESFIEKYLNLISWYNVSARQNLSEEFIEKYRYKVNWNWICKYQKLSDEFKEKHKERLSK